MIFFITVLRALAACLITNSHYTGIYPTDLIANGGLIGDVLFFAVSGYCLYNIKYGLSLCGFAGWYGKRIWRVYPSVIIMTMIYMFFGKYTLREHRFSWWYVYPTYYHFVASIVVLYIPFFFIMKIDRLKENIPWVMLTVAGIWIVVYLLFYDKSYYHIDSVYEPMIRFLFMESMLLGAWFRQNDVKLRNQFKTIYVVIAVISFCVYFVSKMLFSHKQSLSQLQFINQIAIFVLLFYIFRTFCGLDGKLEKLPSWLKRTIGFISEMTLEIYVVQYVIIGEIRRDGLPFPINWIALTTCILLAAFILHKVCQIMYKIVDDKIVKRKAT